MLRRLAKHFMWLSDFNVDGKPCNGITFRVFDENHFAMPGIRYLSNGTSDRPFWPKNKLPEQYVQRVLGHSGVQITLDVYGHLMPDVGKEAAERLEGFFFTQTSKS